MKKNIFALPLLLTVCLTVNGIDTNYDPNRDFDDLSADLSDDCKELLQGHKPTQSTSAKPAHQITPAIEKIESTKVAEQPADTSLQVYLLQKAILEIDELEKKELKYAQTATALFLTSLAGTVVGCGSWILQSQTNNTIYTIGIVTGAALTWGFRRAAKQSVKELINLSEQRYEIQIELNHLKPAANNQQ